MKQKIKYIIDEIIDQYLYADETSRPWIIGFSGGKDSTVLLQLVWEALRIIKNDISGVLRREVYVVCNDTMIENPIITEYVQRVLKDIDIAARDQDLPIYVRKTTPRLEDSFFVNLIGRGYPAPNSTFRWCTERLKIKPTSRFILEQVDVNSEVVILLGTRSDESANRAKSINKHSTRGKRLSKHSLHPNIFTYAPIKDLMLEEIWFIINTMSSPWGSSNTELFQVYANASADDYECPTAITENKHSSCGQSRFGCWVCTVVTTDKSMTAQVENGVTWLTPLLRFRNAIVEERNLPENRMSTMRNGRDAINGMGTYSPDYRASLLKRLLLVQNEIQQEKPHVELISNQELIAIQVIWYRDLIFNYKVSKIYNKIYNEEFDMKNQDEKLRRESELLKKVCKDTPENFDLIQDLLALQKNKALLTKKRGLKDDIERKIENLSTLQSKGKMMFIKEIELNNFRIYKGRNKINLLPDNDKNIIIVSGKNGFGKTTFLMSLVWCLYGKQMHKVDDLYKKEIDDKGGYGKYIGNSLNKLADTEGESRFYVSVVFTNVKIPDITCNEIQITRYFDTKTSSSDRVDILIDGAPNELIRDLSRDNQSGEEIFIRDFILPLEIAKFFFFDAEKIVSLAEESSIGQRQALSKAYSEVLGIHKYEELKEQLENLQDDYRKGAAKPEEKKEFHDIEAGIKNKDIEISELESEIENLHEERAEKKYQSEQIQEKLIRDKDSMTVEQLEQLKAEESQLEITVNDAQNELKELFDLIPFALVSETLLAVENQVKNEFEYNQISFKKEQVDDKTDTILEDLENVRADSKIPLDIKVRDFYESEIKRLIKKYFYNDTPELPDNFEKLHDFSENQASQLSGIINTLKYSFKEKLSRIHSDYSQSKSKIDSIRRKIRDAERNAEDTYIKSLRDEKASLDIRVTTIDSTIESIRESMGVLKNEIKALKQKQADLRKKIDVSDKNRLKDEKLEELTKIIKTFTIKFKEEKKKSLENSIKERLDILMHKKDFISRVEVDILGEDNIDINLYDKRNTRIDKSSLSMGERQMYASALLNSLVNESDIEFPVFIDSPMQKFDKDHAENIINNFYPNVSSQVIIFPLIHKELTESEYNLLRKNVSQSYLINNIDHDKSTFLKIDSDNLIMEYNKIYDLSN